MAKSQPAPTAAQEQLDQRSVEGNDNLEAQAKEEKRQQRREVLTGSGGAAPAVKGTPSDMHRSDHVQFNSTTSPERPDQYTVSNPNTDALYGHFVTVTGGEHAGAYGVYVDNVQGAPDGSARVVSVRTRDADNKLITVKYSDLAPAESRGNAPR